MNILLLLILALVLGAFVIVTILFHPYLGVAFTITSLPILDFLPQLPFFSYIIPIIGVATIIGYFLRSRRSRLRFTSLHALGLIFILWFFLSNPQAAWYGSDRNWLFTFFQLWVLMFLTSNLLDTPRKQVVTMVMFSIVAIVSAFFALLTGSIGEEFETSVRSSGLTGDINSAARYFVVAMVLITYLRSIARNSLIRFIALAGILVTYMGVFFTVSRTGIILLFTAQFLIILLQATARQRVWLVLVYLISLLLIWLLADSIFNIISSIIPIIIGGEDTFGLRLNLWRAGWQMWLDHPIRGVGIGLFSSNVGPYIWSLEGPRVWRAVAHNSYVQVLTETGFVGFILFVSMVVTALRNFTTINIRNNIEKYNLRNAWLIALIVMLIGGLTKSDQADKLTWMLMGVSVYFSSQVQLGMNTATKQKLNRDKLIKSGSKKIHLPNSSTPVAPSILPANSEQST